MTTSLPTTAEAARLAGVKTFFTGKPCRHGHAAPRRASANLECTVCADTRESARRVRERDARAAAERARYAASPDDMRARSREAGRRHRLEKRDQRNAYLRQWSADNPERSSEIKAKYRKGNPEQGRLDAQRRRCRLRGVEGAYTIADVERITAAQRGRCACCSKKRQLTVDHIHPISRGGSNWPRNIQMLCKPCNSRKHARDPIEFMQAMGALL